MELTRTHTEMQPKPDEIMDKELGGLEMLLRNKSIDQTTYERLRKVLEADREKNIELDCSERDAVYVVT